MPSGRRHPWQEQRFREVEEAYGRPFWDVVRMFAERGLMKSQIAELVGYSKQGFLYLVKQSAPVEIPFPVSKSGPPKGSTRIVRDFEYRALRRQSLKRARWITIRGCTRPVRHWERKAGLSDGQIHRRIKRGWPNERLDEPPREGKNA